MIPLIFMVPISNTYIHLFYNTGVIFDSLLLADVDLQLKVLAE